MLAKYEDLFTKIIEMDNKCHLMLKSEIISAEMFLEKSATAQVLQFYK